jgi:hypothetical protein
MTRAVASPAVVIFLWSSSVFSISSASVSTVVISASAAFPCPFFAASSFVLRSSFGKLYDDVLAAHNLWATFKSLLCITWFVVIYKRIAALERKFLNLTELGEFFLQIVSVYISTQLSNIKLSLLLVTFHGT